MPAATKSWYCDSCRQLIKDADQGMVVWIDLPGPASAPPKGRDIRIVHTDDQSPGPKSCAVNVHRQSVKKKESTAFMSLLELRGPDGLMQLLEMLAEENFPTPELLEIIKRIHIPRYEHARRHFREALNEGVISHDVAYGYWFQDELERVLTLIADK